MSKLNLNLNFSWFDVLKHVIRIVAAVGAILAFRRFFPQNLLPKDFVFTIAVYMLIYVLVSLVVEALFKGKK